MSNNPSITIDSFETIDMDQLALLTGGWSWGDFGRSVGKGVVLGGAAGAVGGAITGPGALIGAAGGAAGGALYGAGEYAGQQLGLWK